VPGWGSASGEAVFGGLVDLMGIDPGDVRYFDYRWATTAPGHSSASQSAHIDETAIALNGYIAGLAAETDREIFLVGFSKGGVTVAEMVARWDEGGGGVADVSGAVILDAPMATGMHGLTQSLGDIVGLFPDDGGYDPISCRVGPFWCKDDRAHLGGASGVPVAVVRNPKAWLTNFDDLPEGLRVYDAPDDGPGFLETLATKPWALPARVTEAHDSVLSNPEVAACIVAEMHKPGTCDLEQVGRHPGPAIWPGTKPKWGPAGSVPV